MNTFETIKKRISANKFDPSKPLSREEIKELISYAAEAPSAFNLQQWRYIAVDTPEQKARLKAVAYNQEKVGTAAVTFIVLGDLRAYEAMPTILKPLVDAGQFTPEKAEAMVANTSKNYINNAQLARDEAIRGASLGAMTLMLAAEAKGLVSGPMVGFDPEALVREFQVPERYIPVMLIAVGHPAPGNFPRKPRLSVDQVLSFDSGENLLP